MSIKEIYRKPFREALRYLHEGSTWPSIARCFGVHRSTVYHWRNGEALPPSDVINAVIEQAEHNKRVGNFMNEMEAALDNTLKHHTLQSAIDYDKAHKQLLMMQTPLEVEDRTILNWQKGKSSRRVKREIRLWDKKYYKLDNKAEISKLMAMVSIHTGASKELEDRLLPIFDRYPDLAVLWMQLLTEYEKQNMVSPENS